MGKEFVPYELAVSLKALGFEEPYFGRFYTKPKSKMFGVDEKGRHYPIKNTSKKLYTLGENFVLNEDNIIIAPLYQQAFRWFREKGRDYHIVKESDGSYSGYFYWDGASWLVSQGEVYEEVELDCLQRLIEIEKAKLE